MAQLVERLHGLEMVAGSIPATPTPRQKQPRAEAKASAGFVFGGLVAGEGSFIVTRKSTPYADGVVRPRFVFCITMADRDELSIRALHNYLGSGSIGFAAPRKPGYERTVSLTINSLRQHHAVTIPFADSFLLPSSKRRQYEQWKSALLAHEAAYPNRWGKGPSPCSVEGCDRPVRGRGLCRSHYYAATGY